MFSPLPSILLVEDDEDEHLLAERVLKRAGLSSLIHIPDGLQAKAFLETQATGGNPALPDIVLMDLKLPGMDGHQVLEWMVTRPELRHLLRYVLSSSGNPEDRLRAERTNITGYFVKPLTPQNIESLKKAYEDKISGKPAPPNGGSA